MEVQNINNVKIYNCSAGKSLPEWLSEQKRRSLLKKNVDYRRRIELIQDFDMPAISSTIRVSEDQQYIVATGIYKPRVKCFDVNQMSMKFERCFDSEVVTFEILSDDYSKMVFLQCDRHLEFHAAHGRYYRTRVPRYGRDIKYHYPSCDLFIVGVGNEIYRLNLERGQYLQPYTTVTSAINKCTINPVHHLLLVGTEEGIVEAWDPRNQKKVGTLDCGLHSIMQGNKIEGLPSISALKCEGAMTLGVGTVNGMTLIYDIRANKPHTVKDHMNGLPISNIEFHPSMDLVYSMDSSALKIWEKQTGKMYTSIAAQHSFNDLCVVPDTGMMFMACESPKMQTFYIPSLGPAPKWCGVLDNLTEEMEELEYDSIYDDYKFVTEKELEELGLDHLRGTNLLRAYMHGYFMNIGLWKRARDVVKPFELDEYKKKKIREKIEEERASLIQTKKLPKVNKDLALKYMELQSDPAPKKKPTNLLEDVRFKKMFENPMFEIDKNSETYNLINPVISNIGKKSGQKTLKNKKKRPAAIEEVAAGVEEHDNKKAKRSKSVDVELDRPTNKYIRKRLKTGFEERLKQVESSSNQLIRNSSEGNREMSFSTARHSNKTRKNSAEDTKRKPRMMFRKK